MALQPAPLSCSLDDFEVYITRPEHRGRRFELRHGAIVEKMPTGEHGYIASVINAAIFNYLTQHPIGYVLVEARFRPLDDPANDRIPDVSFSTRHDVLVRRGPAPGMPDLAVEIKSPDDRLKAMLETAQYYLTHGARLVWLVHPEKRLVLVITEQSTEILTTDDTLDGDDVLPGFQIAIARLFPPRAVEGPRQ